MHSVAGLMNKYPPDADAAGGSGAPRAAFQQLAAAAAPPASPPPYTASPPLPLDAVPLRLPSRFKRTPLQNIPAVFEQKVKRRRRKKYCIVLFKDNADELVQTGTISERFYFMLFFFCDLKVFTRKVGRVCGANRKCHLNSTFNHYVIIYLTLNLAKG